MMNIRPVYPWRRGGSLLLALRIKEGSVVGDEAIRAVGKSVNNAYSPPPGDDADEAFVLDVTYVAGDGATPAYWHFTCDDLVDTGFYLVDARIALAGPVQFQTSSIAIEVTDRVTEAAS